MSIFQRNVVAKYLKFQTEDVSERYNAYKAYFLDPEVQKNIRSGKEEQFQEGFLRDFFAKILGYTAFPSPGYNLDIEFKNTTDSKKADGAILINGEPVGVIELKDHKTKDLRSVEAQAFGYKNNHKTARYVIISNFEKLRFYIDHTEEFEEFDLFNLSEDDFKRLYLILGYVNVEKGLPLTIKSESKSEEKGITENLYKDYSAFKRELFDDILAKNDGMADKLTLFRKTQKLLDRLLFIFFAEDRGLIPPNVILRIIDETEALQEMGEEKSLYDHYKTYFKWLDEGRKSKSLEIFAYNGGLFKKDELLDSLKIDDKLLETHTRKLSSYDFESDVSVDILGHIFEHSLSEIEEIQNELNGIVTDKKSSKRKKDGVFYTPAYITKYIVENTVGALCNNKKAEMKINLNEGDELRLADKTLRADVRKKHIEKLDAYREWLLGLTIVDPACGSGAFLNAAVQFLKEEHKAIDEAKASLFEKNDAIQLVLSDIETEILEKNIFGVDINDESVEIAKLSLWLRTAKPGRKLNNLNNNIKCGNSLISDPKVAGDKAFDWQKEFPEVFAKGGFDVVAGNPPYVQLQSIGEMSDAYAKCGYESYNKGADLYCLFTERGYNLLREGGLQSFIMPNKWMLVDYGKNLRSFMAKTSLRQIINFGDVQIFQDATTYVCVFVTCKSNEHKNVLALSINKKNYNGNFEAEVIGRLQSYSSDCFGDAEWSIQPKGHSEVLKKMSACTKTLKTLPIEINYGIKTGFNDAFYIDDVKRRALVKKDPKCEELIKPLIRGRDVSPWSTKVENQYMIGTYPALDLDIDAYPALKEHLLSFGIDRLKQTGEKGARKKTSNKWFETQDSISYYREFQKPKIIYPNMTSAFPFSYIEEDCCGNDKTFVITTNEDCSLLQTLTAIFNSSLCKLWIWYNCPELQGGTREIRKAYFENFPIPDFTADNKVLTDCLTELADFMFAMTKDLQQKRSKFLHRVSESFDGIKITTALEKFDESEFKTFLAELKKQKIKLTLVQQDEWEEYFNSYKSECNELSQKISAADLEIDQKVYKLYDLTDEEISIVDESF